jgi:hypothetical protein
LFQHASVGDLSCDRLGKSNLKPRGRMMDKTQAIEIEKHLRAASDAISRALGVVVTLEQEDRASFANGLGEIESCLHFDLLRAVYARHPELQPLSDQPAHIINKLRWEDVTLPASVSEADLDSIIFSALTSRDCKRPRWWSRRPWTAAWNVSYRSVAKCSPHGSRRWPNPTIA